jgi:protein-S-isoprenylcysteine O-methyltransferase Ste14
VIWLRTLLFALTVVATALVLVPQWILRTDGRAQPAPGMMRYGGLLLFGAGFALMIWCWYEFVTRGRGTPAPIDPPRRLVVAGPYRYVRNPMYVAALLILVGQAVLFESVSLLWYAAGFGLIAHAFVVGYEERTLARRFGTDYAAYRAAVGRWLPRRLRPYEPEASAGHNEGREQTGGIRS